MSDAPNSRRAAFGDADFRDTRFDDPRLNEAYGLTERPLADVVFDDPRPLAAAGTRLLAQLIDGALVVPLAFAAVGAGWLGSEGLGWAVGGLGMLSLVGYQLLLLAREGQTLGKRAMKVRIVDVATGENPGFGRTFGVRGLVNGLLASIPGVGALYGFADLLFIFRDDRRCIHDHLARTIVVSERG